MPANAYIYILYIITAVIKGCWMSSRKLLQKGKNRLICWHEMLLHIFNWFRLFITFFLLI